MRTHAILLALLFVLLPSVVLIPSGRVDALGADQHDDTRRVLLVVDSPIPKANKIRAEVLRSDNKSVLHVYEFSCPSVFEVPPEFCGHTVKYFVFNSSSTSTDTLHTDNGKLPCSSSGHSVTLVSLESDSVVTAEPHSIPYATCKPVCRLCRGWTPLPFTDARASGKTTLLAGTSLGLFSWYLIERHSVDALGRQAIAEWERGNADLAHAYAEDRAASIARRDIAGWSAGIGGALAIASLVYDCRGQHDGDQRLTWNMHGAPYESSVGMSIGF